MIPPSPSLADRLTAALGAFIATRTAPARFYGKFGYRVVKQSGSRVDVEADDAGTGLPSMVRVQLVPAIDGSMPTLRPGTAVLLEFVNGDPSRPIVCGGDPTAAPISVDLPAGVTNIKGVTNMGALPLPLAGALGTVTAFEAVAVALDAVNVALAATGTIIGACTGPTAGQRLTYNGALSTCDTAIGVADTALSTTAPADIPTTETNGT